ncbi:site-specific integrase [Hymenobacter aerilatus]|uniref:Site-specific integrase n=1 Tax=Hymenobacter aerilatus TaxID=2932251 RepID=A0A8T9SWV9_9BACT|nr:tyrosine-type recombinase/integrase [Hymenobacter aerilatus]UOR05881.1 site-specific integrase [Hymenobacter aerilatus]
MFGTKSGPKYFASSYHVTTFGMFYKVKGISKKTGLGVVNVVFRDDEGKETLKSTGVQVKPAHFNTKTGKISPKDPLFPEKNVKIQAIASEFEKALRDLERAEITPTATMVGSIVSFNAAVAPLAQEMVLTGLKEGHAYIASLEKQLAAAKAEVARIEANVGITALEKPILFQDKLEAYKEVLKRERKTEGTIKNYTVAGNALTKFRPNVHMKDISLTFLQDFQNHLIDRNILNNTIREIFVKVLAVYKYYAFELDLPITFLTKFKIVPPRQDENKIILEDNEIKEIEDLEIKTKGQYRTRECFLFCMETGLRYSDILSAEKKNIITDKEGNKFLSFATQKYSKQVEIPLTRKALEILERNKYQFSRPQESQYNQALQAMAKKCPAFQVEITKTGYSGDKVLVTRMPKWKALTSHLARKKFTDNALDKDVTLMALAEYLGHTNTNTLQKHYANKKRHAKKEAYKLLGE